MEMFYVLGGLMTMMLTSLAFQHNSYRRVKILSK
jgi:hypothetical protein